MNLWAWGANSHGQLGLGMICEQVQNPSRVDNSFGKIQQIACGGGHSLLIDNKGSLYACGWNKALQLGTKAKESCEFERVWDLSGVNFTNIACGWDFSCGVTDDNFLFVWGSNSKGQLGLPKNHFEDIMKPIKLQTKVYAVSMGLRHTVIINNKQEIWSTGCGKHGQLGLGTEKQFSDRFQHVEKIGKISHIACGQNHTIAWCTDEKALYVWGENKHGQLLLSNEKYKKIYVPQKIDIGVKQDIKKLLSGWSNIILWLKNGSILSWGRNNYGQLGTTEPFIGKIIEIKLPGDRQVKDIALGSEHTICLATDNTLWAWGWNEHANTGIKVGDCVFDPTLVPIGINYNNKISKIYSGGAHNFIITEPEEIEDTC